MHKIVIVNTSPLFYLHRLGYFHLLKKLYDQIIIPHAVMAELEEGDKLGEDVPKITDYNWIKVKDVKIVPAFIKMIPDLGQAESEVLALGCEEIISVYEDLKEDKGSLGRLPKKWLAFLEEVIERADEEKGSWKNI